MKIKSLTLRISIVVSIMTLFVLLATLLTIYYSAVNDYNKEATEETHFKLDIVVERLSKVQTSVEQTANYSVPALQACMTDTMAVMDILTNIVKSNKYVNSAALAYAPNRLEGHPYCIPIAVNYGHVSQYFSDKTLDGEYIYEDWYIGPSLEGTPFWTDPYFNVFNIPVVSYAVPVISKEHGFEGVLTLAVELTYLKKVLSFGHEEEMEDSTTQSKSVNIILDRNTTFLITRNKDYIMNETLFTLAESKNDSTHSYMGKEILAGHDGDKILNIDGEKSVATWRVLPDLGWTAMVITPYSEVYASVNELTYTTFIVALLAAIAAIIILFFTVRRALRPFNRLKAATKLLGEGKYDVELPHKLTERADEIGDLGREFIRMEKAVKKNIDELEQERKNVVENNQMLTTMVHNVVKQLQMPINNMISFTDGLSALVEDSDEVQVIKDEAHKAGEIILKQFYQLNEMANLVSTNREESEELVIMPSNEFIKDVMKGCHQLEECFSLKLNEQNQEKRCINICTNSLALETLLHQLIVEAAKVSKTNEIALSSKLSQNKSSLCIMIEAKTDKPIPDSEKANFFKRFAKQKIDAYATSDYLQLFICYRTAKKLGARLYVDPEYKEGNLFVIELKKAD